MMYGLDYLGLFYLYLACFLANRFGTVLSDEIMGCTQSICDRKNEILQCSNSLILVTSVTSSKGKKDDVMMRNVKRACMGQSTCDVSELCKNRRQSSKNVSYMCVLDRMEGKGCPGSVVRLSQPHGFLRNPKYPAAQRFMTCHWRIELGDRAAVHLTLHDLTAGQRTQSLCDVKLHISAYRCGPSKKHYSKELCGDDGGATGGALGDNTDQLTIVSCGPVDIRIPSQISYAFRFWLGYSVTNSLRSEPVNRNLWNAKLLSQCPNSGVPEPGLVVPLGRVGSTATVRPATMTTPTNRSVTSASGESDDGGIGQQDSTMTVLIVLVCVIGLIAITLSIVLIIVCIRRRRPKVELIEHVYAVPGTSCQTLSHNYLGDNHMGDDPPEPVPRPRFVEPYSDVADARPPDQPPQATPTSPAYADVEEVCDVEPDDKTVKRFQFWSRSRPSVSSQSGSSSHYEDVNPLPVNSANSASKNNAAATKHSTVSKYNASSKTTTSDPAPNKSQGNYSTPGTKGGKTGGDNLGKTAKNARASPVYVHVVDNADSKSNPKSTLTSNSKTQTVNSGVGPLAAKFSGDAATGTSAKDAVGSRAKTDAHSSRLYPLQEGRVASLVSTLNRNKEAKNNGVVRNEQSKVS